jgi:hypothetical protein
MFTSSSYPINGRSSYRLQDEVQQTSRPEDQAAAGALRWLAPEGLINLAYVLHSFLLDAAFLQKKLSIKLDIYSYALLIVEMLTADVPFPQCGPTEAARMAAEVLLPSRSHPNTVSRIVMFSLRGYGHRCLRKYRLSSPR